MTKMWLKFYSLMLLLSACSGVIYHLNDTEYMQMPPLFALDPYEPCLLQSGGVYCVAGFHLDKGTNDKLINLIRNYSDHTAKHYNHSLLDRGVCVTSTCKKFIQGRSIEKRADLDAALEQCMNNSIRREYGLDAKLLNVYYCDKYDGEQQIDVSDWLVAVMLISLLAMSVIGSIYDIAFHKNVSEENNRKGNPYLLSFSIFLNWQELTSTAVKPQVERLKSLHSLKCIITFLTITAHVMWVNASGFTDNPHAFEKAYESIHYQLIFNGMTIVHIFFVLSGFLLTYNLLIHSEKQTITWAHFPKLIFMRWWRLTAGSAVMLAGTATWLRRAGAGPLWRLRVADTVAAGCRRYWWQHLLYINNYAPENRFCAMQTWHIATDMQLCVVGIAVYLALRSRSKILPLASLTLLGVVAPALHVWLQDLDGLVVMNPKVYRQNINDTFYLMHRKGHNNLTPFVLGMATGYLVYHMHQSKINLSNNKILRNLSWCVVPSVLCLFLSGRVLYADSERASLLLRLTLVTLHRVAIGVIAAFTTVSLVMRCNDRINSFLEWPGWVILSRLGYAIYLLHMNIIHAFLGLATQLGHVSFFNFIMVYLGVVFISFIAAVPFYLLVEAPLNRLVKHIFERYNAGAKTAKNE